MKLCFQSWMFFGFCYSFFLSVLKHSFYKNYFPFWFYFSVLVGSFQVLQSVDGLLSQCLYGILHLFHILFRFTGNNGRLSGLICLWLLSPGTKSPHDLQCLMLPDCLFIYSITICLNCRKSSLILFLLVKSLNFEIHLQHHQPVHYIQ